jgi:hypothetical protein
VLELVQLHRDLKGSSRWLEPALERVRAMAARWGTDADDLVNATWMMFAQKSKALGLWVGVRDCELIGHVLADIRMWDGKPVVWVSQLETDVVVTRTYRDYVLKTIDEWALEAAAVLKVTVTEHVMSTPRMVDGWARLSGYEPYRVLHKRRIPTRRI